MFASSNSILAKNKDLFILHTWLSLRPRKELER